MLIKNGQIAHIVNSLRHTTLSPKDDTVKANIMLLQTAIRQAEIVDRETYAEIGESIKKILNNKKSKEIKRELIDKLLGCKVYSDDLDNAFSKDSRFGRDIFGGDWQKSLAKGIKNELQSRI